MVQDRHPHARPGTKWVAIEGGAHLRYTTRLT